MPKRLSKAAIDAVKDSADLYAEVSKLVGVKPGSMATILQRNGDNLNRYDVVELIASHMGVTPAEAVEEIPEVEPVSA